MNSKFGTTQIVLILAVIVIWGVLGFRIFEYQNNQPTSFKTNHFILPTSDTNDSINFKLLRLNGNPFGIKKVSNIKKIEKGKNIVQKVSKPKKNHKSNHNISYKGFSKADDKKVARINMNNRLLFVEENSTIEDITLLSITRDSLLFSTLEGLKITVFRN